MRANAANRLLQHYVDNFRPLPWRAPPGEAAPDPYRVWLSEVMLQQTTVAAVIPRFERFLQRWPTVEALAAAPEQDVLHEWAGLGYYARARNLHACARTVAALGGFPSSEEELRRLPGIGAYTAAAIASIAFDRRAVVVDTNVARVVARLFGVAEPLAQATDRIRGLADELTPSERAGDFAQAMMDLGATICTPKAPRCGQCPLAQDCTAFLSGTPDSFPGRAIKAIKPHRYGIAWWTERDGCVWLVRRPDKGLLGGMAALPSDDWKHAEAQPGRASIRHVFTHFSLDLSIAVAAEPTGRGWWHPIGEIDQAGLPTIFRKAADAMLADDRRLAA